MPYRSQDFVAFPDYLPKLGSQIWPTSDEMQQNNAVTRTVPQSNDHTVSGNRVPATRLRTHTSHGSGSKRLLSTGLRHDSRTMAHDHAHDDAD